VLANRNHPLVSKYGLMDYDDYHFVNQSQVQELEEDKGDFEVML
jgi:hypothetical protein